MVTCCGILSVDSNFLLITSQPETMRRISHTNPVRRCLFPPEDDAEQARNDNFANILQESIKRDREEKIKKWNFDFKNEVPLEGAYEWYRVESDWIGVKSDDVEMKFFPKIENETTPKSVKVENAPSVKKRRRETDVTGEAVKRKIRFD